MNIILLDTASTEQTFAKGNRIYQHVCDSLRMVEGDVFDIGLIDGPRGKAEIIQISKEALTVSISWGEIPEKLRPVTMILGLSRPQTVQKQLNVLATLGVSKMIFVPTERGEPSYANSRVWRDGLWKRHVLEGVEQAFDTHVPEVEVSENLEATLEQILEQVHRIVLDNYESPKSLSELLKSADPSTPQVLAIGSERGWTAQERDLFREKGFTFAHLGQRVLRCETAATIAAAAALGVG